MNYSGFTFAELNSVRASTNKVVCCHFSSDGKLLASGGHDKKVCIIIENGFSPIKRTNIMYHVAVVVFLCSE